MTAREGRVEALTAQDPEGLGKGEEGYKHREIHDDLGEGKEENRGSDGDLDGGDG